jgi:hypothetical protein
MSEESQLSASADGTVMLDIGGDIGALVIMTPAEMVHLEIELSPIDAHSHEDRSWSHSLLPHDHDHDHDHGHGHAGQDGHDHGHAHHRAGSTHVAVRERVGPGGVRYAAIFPGLKSGEYSVWDLDGSVRETVTITGGQVLTVSWV